MVYGRRGGGWAPRAIPKARGWKERIPARGGPCAGNDLLIYTWGPEPGRVLEVPFPNSGGLYRLKRGAYHWEQTAPP